MNRKFSWKLLSGLMTALVLAGFVACNDDDDDGPPLSFREYNLYNYSSGNQVDAGSFRIDEQRDGNARLSITLAPAFRVDNVNFQAQLVARDTNNVELVYASLGQVNGGSGELSVSPILESATNLPVRYADLITKTGYFVRILNGANVQATGEIR